MQRDVDALGDFLAGNSKPVLKRLERQMDEESEREEYERAARFRDQLQAARRALESQEMVLVQPEHASSAERDSTVVHRPQQIRQSRPTKSSSVSLPMDGG